MSGLVWALWTFHYEEHLPDDCSKYECWYEPVAARAVTGACRTGAGACPAVTERLGHIYTPSATVSAVLFWHCELVLNLRPAARCSRMPNQSVQQNDACEFRFDGSGKACKYEDLCDNNQDGWNPTAEPARGTSRPSECGRNHSTPDPQFLGNDSFTGWVTTVNHEIDIEIPANCVNTSNVCDSEVPGAPGARSCNGDFSTANLNNYIYTQNSGSGPAYANMCVKAEQKGSLCSWSVMGNTTTIRSIGTRATELTNPGEWTSTLMGFTWAAITPTYRPEVLDCG